VKNRTKNHVKPGVKTKSRYMGRPIAMSRVCGTRPVSTWSVYRDHPIPGVLLPGARKGAALHRPDRCITATDHPQVFVGPAHDSQWIRCETDKVCFSFFLSRFFLILNLNNFKFEQNFELNDF
jgi:hypothetical protein